MEKDEYPSTLYGSPSDILKISSDILAVIGVCLTDTQFPLNQQMRPHQLETYKDDDLNYEDYL